MAALAVGGYDVTRISTGQGGRGAGGFGNMGDMETRYILTSNGNGLPGLALNNQGRVLRPALRLIALLLLGVLAAACAADPTATPIPTATPTPTPTPALPEVEPALTTHLYALESESVSLESFDGYGGAIESLGDDLLVVTTKGRFALVARDGTVEYLDGSVPMNYAALLSSPMSEQPDFDPYPFRAADLLLKETEEGYILFVTHHYFTGECVRFRLSSTTIRRDAAGVTVSPDWRAIFDAEPCREHFFGWENAGGKLLADGKEHLLVTIGNHTYGQRLIPADLHIGKLVRIEIATGAAEIVATGIRNSQGLARDGAGNVWVTDHGPKGGDELNLLEPGANYGWPLASYGTGYGGVGLWLVEEEAAGQHGGFARPAFAWVPGPAGYGPAVSALAVNDGRQFPLWKDDLLVGSLAAQSLYRVRRHGTVVQYVEQIELGYRIRDLTFMADGRIALLSDGGAVHFLSRSARYCTEEARERREVYSFNCASFAPAPTPDASGGGDLGTAIPSAPGAPVTDPAAGARLFGAQCSVCHDLNAAQHGAGPHLVGVIGRRAGQVEGYQFSPALSSLGVVWTPARLAVFLVDPAHFAPGTTMASTGATAAEARAIADYLTGH